MSEFESSQQKTEELFFEILKNYEDAIFRYLYFRVQDRAIAMDLAQDTFTKVWMYLSRGKKIDYPEAFLYRSAKNTLIDFYKKSKSSSLDDLIDAGFEPETNKTVDEIFKNDDIQTVKKMVDELNQEDQDVIFMRFAEEKPIEEIAKIYGKSINAMTVKIHRIIKKLRNQYENI